MTKKYIDDLNPDGCVLGQTTASLIAFYGSTPIAQRSSADQSTFTTTLTQSTGWGFLTSTAGNQAIALLTEIRATLVALGLFKGSA